MDFILKLEGSLLNRDSTAGQSLGTGNSGTRVGAPNDFGYRDSDITKERRDLINLGYSNVGGDNSPLAKKLERLLLDRPLDQHPYRGDIDRVGKTKVETFSASLSSTVEFGWATFESHSGYLSYERHEDTDTDQTPDQLFEITVDDEAWQFFQDLELSGVLEVGNELRWDVGVYYLTEELELSQETFLSQSFFGSRRDYTQTIHSGAVWAGFVLDFWEDFTLEVGGRYNLEQKEFEITQTRNLAIGGPEQNKDTQLWKEPTWVAMLSYRFTEEVSTYVKYSRGFKAGHFNSNNAKADSADPELVDAYEWGIEIKAWEDRVKFNTQFFFYDYKDYQVFLLEDSPTSFPSLEVRNADDAINFGAEAELVLQPFLGFLPEAFDQFKIEIRPGWLDTRFLDFVDTELRPAGGSLISVEVDFSGNPLPSAPSFQVSGGAEWPIVLGEWGTIIPRWDFSWTDDVAFDPAKGEGSVTFTGKTRHPTYTIGQKPYMTHNVRIDYRVVSETGGGFTLGGWCRNVTDERYKSYAADVSAFTGQILNFLGEPRICGADIQLSW
jgi:iron complex outermembrane receptor protein